MSRQFGQYTIQRKLGEGGMGAVYLVTAPDGKPYALKTLRTDVADSRDFARRFIRETAIAAKLQHPNIVRTHEHGQAPDGTLYLVTEFCPKGGLDGLLIVKGRIDPAEAIFWMLGLARALDYAWTTHHIIHRDIKPANLLLDAQWNAKLADMGLARRTDTDATRLTMEGTIVGSVYYMSPEQALSAQDLDVRSDLYALGATFYHLLSGDPVFEGSTVAHVIKKHVHEQPDPLLQRRPDLPPAFAALIHLLLHKDPDHRPASAAELIDRLQVIAAGLNLALERFPGPEDEPVTAETPSNSGLGGAGQPGGSGGRGAALSARDPNQDTLALPPEAFPPMASRLFRLPAAAAPDAGAAVEPRGWLQLAYRPHNHVVDLAVFTQTPLVMGRSLGDGVDLPLRIYPVAEHKDLCMRVSSRHAQIEQVALPGATGRLQWLLTDLASHNGIQIDGRRLPANDPQPLGEDTTADFAGALQLRLRAISTPPELPASVQIDGQAHLLQNPGALVLTRLNNRPHLACALLADRLPIGGTDPRRALTAPLPTGQVCGTLWWLDGRFYWQPGASGPWGAGAMNADQLAPLPAGPYSWEAGDYRLTWRPLAAELFR